MSLNSDGRKVIRFGMNPFPCRRNWQHKTRQAYFSNKEIGGDENIKCFFEIRSRNSTKMYDLKQFEMSFKNNNSLFLITIYIFELFSLFDNDRFNIRKGNIYFLYKFEETERV